MPVFPQDLTPSVPFSMQTFANASGRTIGQWGLVFSASGLSLFYSSGATTYFIGGSTLSAAQT